MGLFKRVSRRVSQPATDKAASAPAASSSASSTSIESPAPLDATTPNNGTSASSTPLSPPSSNVPTARTTPAPTSTTSLPPPVTLPSHSLSTAAPASAAEQGSASAVGAELDNSSSGGLADASEGAVAVGDEDAESSSSEEDHFDDAASGDESLFEAAVDATPVPTPSPAPPAPPPDCTSRPPREKTELSKPARLVAEKMAEDVKVRPKLGKPLASLTPHDVALSSEDIRGDISVIWKALHLFLSSRMLEAEAILAPASDHRLYYSVGFSLIQALKSLATFEPNDLEAAIQHSRESTHIASMLRKKDHGLFERVGSIAKGSTSVQSVKAMTLEQRHAELVYAECTLLKAVLGIIYSGDFFAFVKEALNMRSAYAVYRTLAKFVDEADAAAGGEDPSIDQDFRSGVCLGSGMISLILSMLPSSVLKLSSVFGITGDRDSGLALLMKPGGWRAGVAEPAMPPEQEGLRRGVCDMVLLMYHLVIASYIPTGGVDLETASHILHYNLDRYPDGIFFLYYAGRLYASQTLLAEAIDFYHRAVEAQSEFKQLAYICYWDLGLTYLAQGNWLKGHENFDKLDKNSNWSKAVYAYAKAVTLYESGAAPSEVADTMRLVPDLLQRVAGKSIPIEKFVARRARKFASQSDRLLLPGLELAYILNALQLAPEPTLREAHLAQVDAALKVLEASEPKSYGTTGEEYWDDYALAHLLRGIILRYIAHPEAHVKNRPEKSHIPLEEADSQALRSFRNVIEHGRDLAVDHHLVYFAHYELGKLHHVRGEYPKAREHYEVVMSGKVEVNKKSKGKVSLQNMVVLRANSGLQVLKEAGH
ncbi:hypothetical protein JCM10213v2_000271 [Rhodosporidiobolus nylandii]